MPIVFHTSYWHFPFVILKHVFSAFRIQVKHTRWHPGTKKKNNCNIPVKYRQIPISDSALKFEPH